MDFNPGVLSLPRRDLYVTHLTVGTDGDINHHTSRPRHDDVFHHVTEGRHPEFVYPLPATDAHFHALTVL